MGNARTYFVSILSLLIGSLGYTFCIQYFHTGAIAWFGPACHPIYAANHSFT